MSGNLTLAGGLFQLQPTLFGYSGTPAQATPSPRPALTGRKPCACRKEAYCRLEVVFLAGLFRPGLWYRDGLTMKHYWFVSLYW